MGLALSSNQERRLIGVGNVRELEYLRQKTMRIVSNNVAGILAGIFAFASFSATRVMAADWPCFRGPNHDGISTESIVWPKGGPRQVWKINVGIGHSALAVIGDRGYTMGNANETDTVFSI